MPFDTTNMPDFIRHNIGWTENNETDPAPFIPYFDHVEDEANKCDYIIHKDGSLMAMIRLEPEPFDLKDDAARNGYSRRHTAVYKLIGDPQTEISEHLVCHKHIIPFNGSAFGSAYWHEFSQRYNSRALHGARQFDWFITICVKPRPLTGAWFQKMKKKAKAIIGWDDGIPDHHNELVRRLNAKVRAVRTTFQNQNPERLGVYRNEHGVVCSAMARALHLIHTGRLAEFPLVQPAGTFGATLYRDRAIHGTLGFLLLRSGGMNGANVGRMFGLSTYPKETRVGMFDVLLSDKPEIRDACWTMTNHIRPLSRAEASGDMELTLDRLRNTDSYSYSDQDDLEEALNELTSTREIRAAHAWSFMVLADDMETLDEHATQLVDAMNNAAGCTITAVGALSKPSYWSQLPGNRYLCPQPARSIGLRRLSMLSSLEGHPVGSASRTRRAVRWGNPIMRFLNAGGGVYDHELFDGRIGHTLFCGPSDGGKSTAMGAMMTAATAIINNPITGQKGTIFALDKDKSQRLTVLNNGGIYTELKRGEESGAAPLLRLDDPLIVSDLIIGMIISDGGAMPPEKVKEQIRRGVAFEMRKPPQARSIASVHAWLPPSHIDPTDSANRLKPWCRGERLGWAFDGTHDGLGLNAATMIGVDYTALLGDDIVLPIMAAYIFNLAGKAMDGRRFIFVAEELKFLLPKPIFTAGFEDVLLTGRKKNVCFWPAIQQPESLLTHPLGPALMGQCRTRYLFKNELANEEAYCGGGKYGDGLHCTESEYKHVRETMTAGTWSVLIQRPGKSVLCRFDLSSQKEDLAILSGTPALNNLWDKLSEQRKEYFSRLQEAEA